MTTSKHASYTYKEMHVTQAGTHAINARSGSANMHHKCTHVASSTAHKLHATAPKRYDCKNKNARTRKTKGGMTNRFACSHMQSGSYVVGFVSGSVGGFVSGSA